MNAPRHLYLLGAPGAARDRALRALEGFPVEVMDDAGRLLPLSDREPGVVLVVPERVPRGDLGEVLLACATSADPWTGALVVEEDGELAAVLLEAGYRVLLPELAHACATGEGDALVTLADVVERVRTARHDINNPLAAGLAETQLLLMDVTDEEVRGSLEAIEEQLRRIRDLVGTLRAVRAPGREPPHGDRLPP